MQWLNIGGLLHSLSHPTAHIAQCLLKRFYVPDTMQVLPRNFRPRLTRLRCLFPIDGDMRTQACQCISNICYRLRQGPIITLSIQTSTSTELYRNNRKHNVETICGPFTTMTAIKYFFQSCLRAAASFLVKPYTGRTTFTQQVIAINRN